MSAIGRDRLGSEALPHRSRPARDPGRGAGGGTLLSSAVAVVAIAAIAIFGAPPGSADRSPAKLLAGASGDLVLTNTKEGEPLVTRGGIAPGESVSGVVRIGNASHERVRLRLLARPVFGIPGVNGGNLANALLIRVTRVRFRRPKRAHRAGRRARRVKRTIYDGRLKKMGTLRLGRLGPFRGRRYKVTVKLPDRGTPPGPTQGDNALQASFAATNLIWRAR